MKYLTPLTDKHSRSISVHANKHLPKNCFLGVLLDFQMYTFLFLQIKEDDDCQSKPLPSLCAFRRQPVVLHFLSSKYIFYFLSYLTVLEQGSLHTPGQPKFTAKPARHQLPRRGKQYKLKSHGHSPWASATFLHRALTTSTSHPHINQQGGFVSI